MPHSGKIEDESAIHAEWPELQRNASRDGVRQCGAAFDGTLGKHKSRNPYTIPAECNILERFVLRQCGAVAACESWLLRAAANGSLRGDAPLGSMTLY
jgi:hypothetical protein